MSISFRNNCDIDDFGADYHRIRKFLIDINDIHFMFGRWDWMVSHSYLDKRDLSKIALWEDKGKIVALATFDCTLGGSYFSIATGYEYLKGEMLDYSRNNLSRDGNYQALISDGDREFQDIAAEKGFLPTRNREEDAYFPIDLSKLDYLLPKGFKITSMAEEYDLFKYGQVLWKGFNHGINGEGPYLFDERERKSLESSMIRPNVNLNLKIAVKNDRGDFVSYCGMWQDRESGNALVEPVATDPRYRRLGLGKAAVWEGIRRCGALGASTAWVGSSQQFYYSIGFRPSGTYTWWEKP